MVVVGLVLASTYASPVKAAATQTTIYATQGGYCADNIDDGAMQFQICGGYDPGHVANVAYVDTRLDSANDSDRFSRGALEFNLLSLYGPGNSGAATVRSAILTLQPLAARNLMQEGFPPPVIELWGYVGDGSVNEYDMFSGAYLGQFVPANDPGNGPGGADWLPVNIDLTAWLRDLMFDDTIYAGFRLNVAGDLSGARNLLSDFYYGASTSGVDGANDGNLEWRPRLTVTQAPEPGSLALLGLGLVGLVVSRRQLAT